MTASIRFIHQAVTPAEAGVQGYKMNSRFAHSAEAAASAAKAGQAGRLCLT